ncbi:MAG: pentapeptide repeat-containing protein [Cyanobacteria bacterium P01_E01_bin.45]
MHSPPLQDVLFERYSQGERDLRDLGDRLHAAELSNLHLEHCNLEGANLANSSLTQVTLKSVDLGEASLQGAQWSEVSLSGSNLKQANLSHAFLSECDLKFCIFSGASFEGADIRQCQIHHSVFINATYDRTTVFPPNFAPAARGMIEVSPSAAGLPDALPAQAETDFPPNFAPAESGTIEVSPSAASLPDAPPVEADIDLDPLEVALPPLVPGILDDVSDSQTEEALRATSNQVPDDASAVQKQTYFYRGRRIEK